jgi:LacI family transcriptional regulator
MVGKQRHISLKDLASQLGVSIATVSRALRNSPEIGAEMRERVNNLAKELKYRPNPFAQSLRREAPRIIGVVVPNLVTHYYAGVLDGIEDAAIQSGYSMIISNTHEDYQKEVRAIDNFVSLHVEGIIACLAQDTTDYTHFTNLKAMNIPLVFFARTSLNDEFSSVIANGDEAAQMATQHLIDTGSLRIGFIGGPNHLDMVRRRKHGYLEALRLNGMPIDRSLVECHRIDFDDAYQHTSAMLSLPNPPDAILAFNDIITFAALQAIQDRGLRIPDDVALIGFTDDRHATYITPKISAIMDQAHLTGERACQLLLKQINGDTSIYHEVVPMILEIRDSSSKKKEK